MYCPKQISLFTFPKSSTGFGGSLNLGRRKVARPLCAKRSIHIVMHSVMARGELSLLKPPHARLIHRELRKYSSRFEVRVYEYANVGNHIHLLIKAKTKEGLRNFLRVFAGQVAQKITGAKPHRSLK